MKMRKYAVEIEGLSPLLMHNDNLEWSDNLKKWRNDPANKKKGTAGDDRSPAWTWIGSLYVDQGIICIPSDNLMTMLREGGQRCPTGKRQGTFKALTQSGIVIDQVAWPVECSKGTIEYATIEKLIENEDFEQHLKTVEEIGFTLFVKRAKIEKAKHVRVRPRFDTWRTKGTLTVFEDMITTDVLTNILNFGGAYAGIGDWRPSSPMKPGQFGRFTSKVNEI